MGEEEMARDKEKSLHKAYSTKAQFYLVEAVNDYLDKSDGNTLTSSQQEIINHISNYFKLQSNS